jgi:hypothetical protein
MLCQKNKPGLQSNPYQKQILLLILSVFQDETTYAQSHFFYFRLKLFLSKNLKKIIHLIQKIFYQFLEALFTFSFFSELCF